MWIRCVLVLALGLLAACGSRAGHHQSATRARVVAEHELSWPAWNQQTRTVEEEQVWRLARMQSSRSASAQTNSGRLEVYLANQAELRSTIGESDEVHGLVLVVRDLSGTIVEARAFPGARLSQATPLPDNQLDLQVIQVDEQSPSGRQEQWLVSSVDGALQIERVQPAQVDGNGTPTDERDLGSGAGGEILGPKPR